VNIQLAYYPPYHSKYNPVERVWGVLENHWRGEIIDSVEKALGLARSMTYRHLKPSVRGAIQATGTQGQGCKPVPCRKATSIQET
jgi:transposase